LINIGKTPLIRAENIEKILGIKKLYLKLEGNNPTRSKYDRIAEVIAKAAQVKKKNAIIIDGEKRLLRAMNYICQQENILLLVPKYKNDNWKEKIVDKDQLIDLSGVKKNDLLEVLKNLTLNNQAFLVDENSYKQLSLIAYEQIAEEIHLRYQGEIDSVFYHSDVETSYHAYQNVFLKKHLLTGEKLPEIYGSNINNNQVYPEENLVVIDDALLVEATTLLQKYEHLKVKQKDVAPFAAFLKSLRAGKISEGRHVIVLDTARSRININQITDFSTLSKNELVDYVDNYLDQYSDSKTEALEAIELAVENGYILTASRGEEIDGVLVIVHMGFEKFIPTYHLAYIGINPNSKGRGLGSELIKEAINLTNGNISLHVDLDNKNAKRLYKKMGFAHVYDRMIYQRTEK